MNNLRYRGLFKALQNMKRGEISKITLKGLECFHIHCSKENIYTNKGSGTKKMDPYNVHKAPVKNVDRSTCRNNHENNSTCDGNWDNTNNIETSENNISINTEGNTSKESSNNWDNINDEITKTKKELIIELVHFKRSKTVNIKSIINMNRTEKLFFYLYEDNRKYYNKPIIDVNCELIIHMTISKNINKDKRDKLFLPIKFYSSNNSYIKKSKAYFLFSYGSCFTSPIWFYESFKGMKEGDELIIPLSKNKNICSEDYFIYHLLYDDIFLKDQNSIKIQKSTSACVTKEIKNKRNNESNDGFVKERKSILSSPTQIEDTNTSSKKKKHIESSPKKNTNLRNETINHEKKFLKWLISNRNLGKGFFLINGLKKRKVNSFCKSFFSLQNHFIEEFNYTEGINRLLFYLRSFKKNVYFDKNFYEKDAILKIKIVKILCKKKDSWNMNIKEQVENLKIYNRIGNDFMKINLYYAASIYYKKGFDIFRFSKIYNLIFEEKKIDILYSQQDEQIQEFTMYMEKILTNLSNCLYKLNDYNESINFADKALIINPQNVKTIYWKNMSYLQMNKYNEILQNLNNSFCLNNTSLLKLYNTARMIKKTHDTKFNSLFYGMYDQK
ncbi:TPR Domain, putative [Plasmodium yoelii yoelii]|uniref:TPR Domain, putative n=1 Tax=Plasmodium yoelii yoelii TaxID=73239 RepID=Q7PDS8_PLAYO|nr:TPR Domain, putative [Plasmodium yoelii yoelii]